jgi:hypothetical protein
MKMLQHRGLRSLLQVLGIFGATMAFQANRAEAQWIDEIGRCDYHSGFLAFAETTFPNEVCGYVAGKNPNWALLPGRNWDNKADAFWNRGTTHNACIYTGTGYKGSARLIRRNESVIDVPAWKNVVSSNHWTTTSTCPR